MKRERHTEVVDLSGRIRSLEQFRGGLAVRRPAAEPGAVPVHEAPTSLPPTPRRSRVYLRGRDGSGGFAELTVTAPGPRGATD